MSFSRQITAGDVSPIQVPWDHPGYVVGKFYTGRPGVQFATGSAATANTIKLYPFQIKQRLTINALMTRINTLAAGGNVQLAIYGHNAAVGTPTGVALASTASISTASAGNFSSAASAQLAEGFFWGATNADNATVVLESISQTDGWAASIIGSAAMSIAFQQSNGFQGVTVAQTFGTWPDLTSASFTEIIAQIPINGFKVASVP